MKPDCPDCKKVAETFTGKGKKKAKGRPIPNGNAIQGFVHCGLCMREMEANKINESPRDYSRLEVGMTPIGLQVWCVRHGANVLHIDFEGHVHPANTTMKARN
jgi:hypothetical protein